MSTKPAPSFAVTASAMLRQNLPVDAAKLCARGLEYFPNYIVGYLLLSEAYHAMGQQTDALLILQEARSRFPQHAHVIDERSHSMNQQELIEEPPAVVHTAEPILAMQPATVLEIVVAHAERKISTESVLRIIDTAPHSNDQRIIRSASVRLIPGLEYTTLRFEGMRSRGRREISQLSEPPPFREFHTMLRMTRPAERLRESKRPVSLEELASRLERARMPRPADMPVPVASAQPTSTGPTVVTETIARIYMQQGSFDRAIEAFQVLQKAKPEHHSRFEALIAECEQKRS